MKYFLIPAACWLVAGCTSTRTTQVEPKQVTLTVDDVLKMSKAKVPDKVIVAKIHASRMDLQLSPEFIISLKEQGLGADVLEALVQKTMPEREPEVVYRYAPTYYPYYDPWYDSRWSLRTRWGYYWR